MSNYKVIDLRATKKVVSVCECGHKRINHAHWGEGEPDDCFFQGCDCRRYWDPINKVNYDEAGYI